MSQTLVPFYALRIERRDTRRNEDPLVWFAGDIKLDPLLRIEKGEIIAVTHDKDNIWQLAHAQLSDIINSELSAEGNEDIFLDLKEVIKREPDPDNPSSVLYEIYFSSADDFVHPVIIYTLSLVEVHLKQHG